LVYGLGSESSDQKSTCPSLAVDIDQLDFRVLPVVLPEVENRRWFVEVPEGQTDLVDVLDNDAVRSPVILQVNADCEHLFGGPGGRLYASIGKDGVLLLFRHRERDERDAHRRGISVKPSHRIAEGHAIAAARGRCLQFALTGRAAKGARYEKSGTGTKDCASAGKQPPRFGI